MKFTPNVDFVCKELGNSHYLRGLVYTVRPRPRNPAVPGDAGTPLEKTKLFELVQTWTKEGKVQLITDGQAASLRTAAGGAGLRGRGKVE